MFFPGAYKSTYVPKFEPSQGLSSMSEAATVIAVGILAGLVKRASAASISTALAGACLLGSAAIAACQQLG